MDKPFVVKDRITRRSFLKTIGIVGLASATSFLPALQVKGGSTTVEIWHMEKVPHRIEVINQILNNFNKSHPNITIQQQPQSWATVRKKARSAIAVGRPPDVLFSTPDFTQFIKKTGAVNPVDSLLETLDKEVTFFEAAKSPYRYEGHNWAIPVYDMVKVMWYRKDLYEQAGLDPDRAPRTWDEMLNAATKINEELQGVSGIGVPSSKHIDTNQEIYTVMTTNNAKHIFDKQGNVVFNNPNTVEAYAYYKKLAKLAPKGAANWGWAEPQIGFNNGTIATEFAKGQFLMPFEEESGKAPEMLGGAPVPAAQEGYEGTLHIPNGIMVLTDDGAKVDAFTEFLLYLYKPSVKGKFLNMEPGLFLPVSESTLNSKTFWSHPVISTYEEYVQMMIDQTKVGSIYGFTNAPVEGWGEIINAYVLAKSVQHLVIDDWSAERAVEWADDRMKEIVG